MIINVGNHEFSEVWDGVFYKALSDYPNVCDNEMKDIYYRLYRIRKSKRAHSGNRVG